MRRGFFYFLRFATPTILQGSKTSNQNYLSEKGQRPAKIFCSEIDRFTKALDLELSVADPNLYEVKYIGVYFTWKFHRSNQRKVLFMSTIVASMMKMKSGNLVGIGNHNQRRFEKHSNPAIDVERSHLNYDLVNRDEPFNYKTDIEKFINENKSSSRAVRKDAVLVNEWIISSDKGFFENKDDKEIERFFTEAKDYFAEKYGEKNVRYAQVHLDESTPHMHLGIVPFDQDNKLSAKRLFNRKALIEIQDELPVRLNERGFELERGEKGSKRSHLSVDDYKAYMDNKKALEAELTDLKKVIETTEEELVKKKEEIKSLSEDKPVNLDMKKLKVHYEFEDVKVPSGEKFMGIDIKKTEQQRTGNLIIPQKSFDLIAKDAVQNVQLKQQVKKYMATDLVKENQKLEDELGRVKRINSENVEIYYDLEKKYKKVVAENDSLRSVVRSLKNEIKTIYRELKDTFKQIFVDKTKSKEVTKDFAMKIEQNAPKSEFKRLERDDNRTVSRGMSR